MLALRRASLAVMCLVGFCGLTWAQKIPDVESGNSAGVKVAASTALAERYAGEAVVVEHLDTQYRYAADGTGTRQTTMVLLVQTEASVRQFGVVTVPYASSDEHVELDYVRVRRPDGTVIETPVTDAQDMPAAVTRQAPFYSDLKEMQIPVRSLQVGSRLEYRVRTVRTKSEAPGQFWGEHRMVEGVVVLSENVELRFPKGKDVTVWSPFSKPVITEEGTDRVYRWTSSATDPTVGKQADAKKEADKKKTLTDAEQLDRTLGKFPLVAWTTFKSWDEVGAWYRGLEVDRTVADGDVKAKVAELTAGKTTDEEKIQAIYSYVATQIRYIGVAFGVGRYQPHTAGDVLRNQYGDCKDKHTLLAAMLGAAGIQSDAVLIGANIRFNPDVPSPGAFNHLITAVPMGKETIWLDATQEVAPYRVLLSILRDKQALVVPMTGAAQIKRTPADLPFKAFDEFDAKAVLNESGTVTSHIAMKLRGDDEVTIRAILRQLSPGQYDDFAQRFSQGLGFGGTTSHAQITRPDATQEPLQIAYDYTRDKPGDWQNYRIVPELTPVYLPVVDQKNPPQVPINLGVKRIEMVKTEMKLPDGWAATLPDAVHVHTAFVNFDKTYRFQQGTLYVDREIEVLEEKVPAASWKEYKKFTDDAAFENGETYVQLTRAVKKAGEAGPPLPSVNNNQAEELLSQAAQTVRSWDLDGTTKLLDQAKKLNDKQPNLWSMYGYVASLRGAMTEATADFQKELDLHPDEQRVYLALAQAQMMTGKKDDARKTLQSGLAQAPDSDEIATMLASILNEDGSFAEEAKMLEPISAKQPDNTKLHLLLGSAEMKAGRLNEGSKILIALIKNSSDANVLNDASYALADQNMDLDLAEASITKAVDLLTKDTETLTIDTDPKVAAAKETMLAAAWDTMGWVYFREHKLDLAEDYLRAAWLTNSHTTVGLHLGQVQEARGQMSRALNTYEMAQSAGISYRRGGTQALILSTDQELRRRSNLLRNKGARDKFAGEPSERLQGLRKLPIGSAEGRSGTVDYAVLMENGHVDAVKGGANNALHNGDEMVKRLVAQSWWPKDSNAKMLRRGFLNCHSGICEFVMLPL